VTFSIFSALLTGCFLPPTKPSSCLPRRAVGAKRFADLSHNKGLYGAESKDPGNAAWRMLLRAFRPETTTEVKDLWSDGIEDLWSKIC
jgi:hypothetical protein